MVVHTVLLVVHIAAGVAGLLLGPAAMAAAVGARPSRRGAPAYQVAVAVVCTTAVGFAVLAWHRWWPFVLLAVGTEAAALGAWRVGRARSPGWRARHIRLLCGSYISLVTALFVVSWSSPLAWVVPIVVGTVLVERLAVRAAPAPVSAEAGGQRRRSPGGPG